MRTLLIMVVSVLGGCVFTRDARIREGATAVDPACANVRNDWEEIEPWLWQVNCAKGVKVWCRARTARR
jgi:hypothetical protein